MIVLTGTEQESPAIMFHPAARVTALLWTGSDNVVALVAEGNLSQYPVPIRIVSAAMYDPLNR
jgi:hypothetical protein